MTTIDTQSLILGMGLVLFIACAIGGVVALVKVTRLERSKNNIDIGFQQQIDNVHKLVDVKVNEINNQIGNVYRDMDSRFDKMYNKIMTDTNPKHRILSMIRPGKGPLESTDEGHKE
jgi:hypothetical protein